MNGAMSQAIIFDLDGTLVDSCGVCVEILQEMVVERAFDYRIDPVFARQYMSRGGEMMVASLLGPAARDRATDLHDHTLGPLANSAKQCVYVGDSELDHETASARGVPFHFLNYGYADPDWEPAGCHVHNEFDQLVGVLAERAVLPVR